MTLNETNRVLSKIGLEIEVVLFLSLLRLLRTIYFVNIIIFTGLRFQRRLGQYSYLLFCLQADVNNHSATLER